MGLFRVCAQAGACIVILASSACDRAPTRRFPTKQAALEQLRAHQDAYKSLAQDWFATGYQHLYWFGRSKLGREIYTWNGYWVRELGPSWEVSHWDGREYVNQRATSFEETARLSRSSADEVSRWLRRLESLGIDKTERVSVLNNGVNISFVRIGYFPESNAYGFLFVPEGDVTTENMLNAWAKSAPQRLGHRLEPLGDQWFYYEGHQAPPSSPRGNAR
jgi:hypothetical protein